MKSKQRNAFDLQPENRKSRRSWRLRLNRNLSDKLWELEPTQIVWAQCNTTPINTHGYPLTSRRWHLSFNLARAYRIPIYNRGRGRALHSTGSDSDPADGSASKAVVAIQAYKRGCLQRAYQTALAVPRTMMITLITDHDS